MSEFGSSLVVQSVVALMYSFKQPILVIKNVSLFFAKTLLQIDCLKERNPPNAYTSMLM